LKLFEKFTTVSMLSKNLMAVASGIGFDVGFTLSVVLGFWHTQI